MLMEIFLIIIIIILIVIIYFASISKNPYIGNCLDVKVRNKNTEWSNDCKYIFEKSYDGNLKKPTKPLYLSGFSSNDQLGPGLKVNVWYRYRFVRGTTGGYSDFSPWTRSGIIAGSETLPCKEKKCSSDMRYSGKKSTNSNVPTLSIDSLEHDLLKGEEEEQIYANVHRVFTSFGVDKPPNEKEEGEIIGFLIPTNNGTYKISDFIQEKDYKDLGLIQKH